MTARALGTVALLAGLAACSAPGWPAPPGAEEAALEEQAGKALDAHAALLEEPAGEDRIIWYGRRLGYLGRYEDAIAVYTRGLASHPESAKLLRHRGHRFISLRRFDEAVASLQEAADLIAGTADEVEPDGLPNARNQPTSTLHTNVWYHLGLAHYCRGEFTTAMDCYERCLEAAGNHDMEVAARYWLFLSAQRAGETRRAHEVLLPVGADWDIIENDAYHRLLLLFRGELGPDALQPEGGDAIEDATAGYGLARWYLLHDEAERGTRLLRDLAGRDSPAFGCIAAEVDVDSGSR